MYYKVRRRQFGQNFLVNYGLIRRLLRKAGINAGDQLVEFGAGSGNITQELSKISKQVTAIEIDYKLVLFLKKRFCHIPKVRIIEMNFLKFSLPRHPYKVFSNIPFNLQSDVVMKLFESSNPPVDCYLVLEKKFVRQLIRATKDISCTVVHYFQRQDFIPQPNTAPVLVRITKKHQVD